MASLPSDGLLTLWHVKCGDLFVNLNMDTGTYYLDKFAIPFKTRESAQSFVEDHENDQFKLEVVERTYDLNKISAGSGSIELGEFQNTEGVGVDKRMSEIHEKSKESIAESLREKAEARREMRSRERGKREDDTTREERERREKEEDELELKRQMTIKAENHT